MERRRPAPQHNRTPDGRFAYKLAREGSRIETVRIRLAIVWGLFGALLIYMGAELASKKAAALVLAGSGAFLFLSALVSIVREIVARKLWRRRAAQPAESKAGTLSSTATSLLR